MLIWFAVGAALLVVLVFQSPAVDVRTVALGAVLPVGEAVLGGPRVLHSVLGAVAVLVVTMLATRGRRLLRRRLLGVPIGLFAHLVLDGSFTRTSSFWWPAAGTEFASGQVPEVAHLGLSLILELVGVALAFWAYHRFGLDDPDRRQRLVRDGRIEALGA